MVYRNTSYHICFATCTCVKCTISVLKVICVLFAGSNEVLLLKEQRLRQSLDTLNSRLRSNGQGGIKQGTFGKKVKQAV